MMKSFFLLLALILGSQDAMARKDYCVGPMHPIKSQEDANSICPQICNQGYRGGWVDNNAWGNFPANGRDVNPPAKITCRAQGVPNGMSVCGCKN